MGLDMYAFTTAESFNSPVDFDCDTGVELHYWRKHPNLHGWMHELYAAKGGANPDFNLSTIALSADDLDALERVVTEGRLPETGGFFFGASDGSERENDLEFVAAARVALARGDTVFYTAWW